MPKDEFDHEDPMELISMPMPEDGEMESEMARCLAEEFMRMGESDEEILAMFRNPFYSVPHGVFRTQGEDAVKEAIAQARANWIPVNL
ncbi:MAG: hypothetical protein QF701_02930 [Nitrospinota bacterium]|jgi:hypothetical protein|nr:hypothetical protein [Nitrospinota bacterium]MDP7166703.1 hypothetical protein [Nitrospinota bacterium]MDP7503828.1 hypothetical protein [Nitrospinota bacterium]MDP7663112.1 hypothetical protein [Nitrospinota bacterium]